MNKILCKVALALALVSSAAVAQTPPQIIPQLALDKSGPCRRVTVYDANKAGADKMTPLGCVDAASKFQSPGSLPSYSSLGTAAASGSPIFVPPGTTLATAGQTEVAAGTSIDGAPGLYSTSILKKSGFGNLLGVSNVSDVSVSKVTLDLSGVGVNAAAGQTANALRAWNADRVAADKVYVKGLAGIGTGIIMFNDDHTKFNYHGTIRDSIVVGDQIPFGSALPGGATANTNGVLLDQVYYGLVTGNRVVGTNAFAQEFKNNTRWSILANGISAQCGIAFGLGQQNSGDGSDHIILSNLIARACDQGLATGGVDHLLASNILIDNNGSQTLWPGTKYGMDISGTTQSLFTGILTDGPMIYPVRLRGDSTLNAVEIASFDQSSKIATLDAGAAGNYVRIIHPGTRTTILGNLTDNSGNGLTGANGNVFTSDMTREYLGSRSGAFLWELNGPSGGSYFTSQGFRFENNGSFAIALSTPGTANDQVGIDVNTAATRQVGYLKYTFGNVASNDYWLLGAGSAAVGRFYSSSFTPSTDNAYSFGAFSARLANVYATTLSGGSGMLSVATPMKLATYTVAGVPSASTYAGASIRLSDGANGRNIATSNGTVWQYPDGTAVGDGLVRQGIQRVGYDFSAINVTSTTAQTTVKSNLVTLPSNYLNVAGVSLRVVVKGVFTAGSGASVQVLIGGTQIGIISTSAATTTQPFEAEFTINPVAASAQRVTAKLLYNVNSARLSNTSAAVDLSGSKQVDVAVTPTATGDQITVNCVEAWLQ